MATPRNLPTNRSKWLDMTKNSNATSFAGGDFLPSGSQFALPHFLRLHILHRPGGKRPDAKGFIQDLAEDHRECFPKKLSEELKIALNKDKEIQYLSKVLANAQNVHQWKKKGFVPSGRFAVGLELLHLIVARTPLSDDTEQDDAGTPKVFSPYNTRSHAKKAMPDLTSPLARLSLQSGVPPQTPTSKGGFVWEEDISQTSIDLSPGSVMSPPNTELRRIEDDYERTLLVTGDEQTVNACLIALLIALSHVLGSTGRIHFDRVSFLVRRADEEPLFRTCVDGVIKTAKGRIKGFVEVKRYIRSERLEVRMQEAAQMAAFIYENSKSLDEKRYHSLCRNGELKLTYGFLM